MSQSRRFKSRADLSRNDPPLSHRDRLKSPPPGLRHDPPIPDVLLGDESCAAHELVGKMKSVMRDMLAQNVKGGTD